MQAYAQVTLDLTRSQAAACMPGGCHAAWRARLVQTLVMAHTRAALGGLGAATAAAAPLGVIGVMLAVLVSALGCGCCL